MTRHLSDEEMAVLMAGGPGPEAARAHLESCMTCRRELEALSALVAAGRSAPAREEPDWESQRRRILAALTGPPAEVVPIRRSRTWRGPLAAAAVLALAAGLWLGIHHRESPAPEATATLSVEQVLADVEATLSDTSVPGFEPLEGLVPDPDELEGLVSDPAS